MALLKIFPHPAPVTLQSPKHHPWVGSAQQMGISRYEVSKGDSFGILIPILAEKAINLFAVHLAYFLTKYEMNCSVVPGKKWKRWVNNGEVRRFINFFLVLRLRISINTYFMRCCGDRQRQTIFCVTEWTVESGYAFPVHVHFHLRKDT